MRDLLPLTLPTTRVSLKGRLCFFGFGEMMRTCFDQLVLVCGRRPDLICDNAPRTWGQSHRGIPVVPPEQLQLDSEPQFLVIITIRQYEAVYAQLASMGISDVLVADYERAQFRLAAVKAIGANKPCDANIASEKRVSAQLAGKWALITGAARGLGAEIAGALADRGVNLLLHGRNASSLEDTLTRCLERGVHAAKVTVDLADTKAVELFAMSMTDKDQKIDFLINNAAISPPADRTAFPYSAISLFDECLRVNALAPIVLIQHLLPQMLHERHGVIINVSSSITGNPFALHYSCSKAVLDKYVVDIHKSLKGTGVSIVALDPGWLKTPMTNFRGLHDPSSAINGIFLPLLMDLNGCWISAQDFSGMTLQSAVEKARQLYLSSNSSQ